MTNKQEWFIQQLTEEFIKLIQHYDHIRRGRATALTGFRQNALNTVASLADSMGGSIGSVVSAGLSIGTEAYYQSKTDARVSTVNTAVFSSLETHIRDHMMHASTQIAHMWNATLETLEAHEIRDLADCAADRIVNYMTKHATTDSGLDFWSAAQFIQGVLKGRSGRFKDGIRNRDLQGNLTMAQSVGWASRLTAEGLFERSSFVTQSAQHQWVYYVHPDHVNNPLKYLPAIFPEALVAERINAGFKPFTPTSFPLNETQLASTWSLLQEKPTTPPTLNTVALSREVHDLSTYRSNVQTQLTAFGDKLETLEQIERYQAMITFWENHSLDNPSMTDISDYSEKITEWLSALSAQMGIEEDVFFRFFCCVGLHDVNRGVEALNDQEIALFALSPDVIKAFDFLKVNKIAHFPLAWDKEANLFVFLNASLKHYFAAYAFKEDYQLFAEPDYNPRFLLPLLWENAEFQQWQGFSAFVHYHLITTPEQTFIDSNPVALYQGHAVPQKPLLAHLLEDFCQIADKNTHFYRNIQQVMCYEPENCPCIFCTGRQIFLEAQVADVGVSSHPDDQLLLEKLPGISPVSPHYASTDNTQKIAWHWPEFYLASCYWKASVNSVESGEEHFIAYSPWAFEEGIAEQESNQKNTQIERQRLEDRASYADYLLEIMTLQENLPKDSTGFILTFKEAETEIQQEATALFNKTITEYQTVSLGLLPDALEHFQSSLQQKLARSRALDEQWIHWQDREMSQSMQETMSSVDASPVVPRSNTHTSVEALQELHKASLETPTESEQKQLYYAWYECKKNYHHLKTQYQQVENNELPLAFNHENVSLDEAKWIIHACLEMSAKKLMILRRYILGAQSVSAWIATKTPLNNSQERISSLMAHQTNQDISIHAPLSPDSIDTNLSQDIHLGFNKAHTPYELLARFVQCGHEPFLAKALKNYTPETHACFENEAHYKKALEEMIASFPALEPTLSQVGSVPTATLKKALKAWEEKIQAIKTNTHSRLKAWEQANAEYQKQKMYHAKSHQMRAECLIEGLYTRLPASHKDVFHLDDSDQQQFMAQINQGQWDPFLRWFMKTFERHRAVIFLEEMHDFLAPYQNYFNEYKQQLDHFLQRFRDTRIVWRKLSDLQKNECYQAMYSRRDGQIILESMAYRWYPLRKKILKKCLQEGLHPHASQGIESKERLANRMLFITLNTHLKTAYEELSPEDFPAYFEQKTVPIYYFLDSGAVTAWSDLLNIITFILHEAPSTNLHPHRALWETLALVMTLFQSFANNPDNRPELQNILDTLKKDLATYWEKFTKSDHSFWGKLWRQETVRTNRLTQYPRFEACHQGMSAHFTHLYACSKALDQESKNLVRHDFVLFKGGQGGLEKIVKRFLTQMTAFFNKINAQSSLPHLAQIDWRKAPFHEVKYATQSDPNNPNRQSLVIVPPAYRNLTYREKTQKLVEAETLNKQLKKEKERVQNQMNKVKDENMTVKDKINEVESENMKVRDENIKVKDENMKVKDKMNEVENENAKLKEDKASAENLARQAIIDREVAERLAKATADQMEAQMKAMQKEIERLSNIATFKQNSRQVFFTPTPSTTQGEAEINNQSHDLGETSKKKNGCTIS